MAAMAESFCKISDKDINQYFGIGDLSQSSQRHTPRWGIKPTPQHVLPPSSSGRTRIVPPTDPNSPIQLRSQENGARGMNSVQRAYSASKTQFAGAENSASCVRSSHREAGKSQSRKKSPSRAYTPATAGGDRYIPNRSTSKMEQGTFLLSGRRDQLSPGKQEYQDYLFSQVATEQAQKRVLSMTVAEQCSKSCGPPERSRSVGCLQRTERRTKVRDIQTEEEKILDAPGVLDDYYLNLLDWSRSNVLAIALGDTVYLWNAESGSVQQLCELPDTSSYISSIAWGRAGDYLAFGTSSNEVCVWDVNRMKRLRSMKGHSQRVSALSWRQHLLTSGAKDGAVFHHDVRAKEHLINRSMHHKLEVCGLKWSRDGSYLAAGSNDNSATVWSFERLEQPYNELQHTAAVKGLAWCPWRSSILATGAGSADCHLRLWNMRNGTCEQQVETGSQVSSIIYSKVNKEIVTGHGPPGFQLSLWCGDSLEKLTELKGHQGRVLKMAHSPCGDLVASLGADETLRLWKCFDPVPTSATANASQSGYSSFSVR